MKLVICFIIFCHCATISPKYLVPNTAKYIWGSFHDHENIHDLTKKSFLFKLCICILPFHKTGQYLIILFQNTVKDLIK